MTHEQDEKAARSLIVGLGWESEILRIENETDGALTRAAEILSVPSGQPDDSRTESLSRYALAAIRTEQDRRVEAKGRREGAIDALEWAARSADNHHAVAVLAAIRIRLAELRDGKSSYLSEHEQTADYLAALREEVAELKAEVMKAEARGRREGEIDGFRTGLRDVCVLGLAREVNRLVDARKLDARSPAADALLDLMGAAKITLAELRAVGATKP